MSVQKDIAEKSALLKAERKSKRMVAVLGTVTFLIIAFALTVPGFGLTREKPVCGLEEHKHGTSCYEEILVCGQEEGENHKHDLSCYEFKLTCDKPVHVHDDSCYEASDDSSDEQNSEEEAKEADSSDAGSTSDDGEPGTESEASPDASASTDAPSPDDTPSDSSDNAGANDADANDADAGSADANDADAGSTDADSIAEEMPEQYFDADLVDGDHKVVLSVAIDAPEGAFPANTAMKIESVDVSAVHDEVVKAVEDAKGEAYKVKQLIAVDITFKDVDGFAIEPAKDVQVRIRASEMSGYEDPLLVHVLDKSKESASGKTYDAEVIDGVKIVNWDEDNKVVGTEDTMKFESRAFSPYVIVGAEKDGDENGNDDAGDDADADSSSGSSTIITTDDDDDADADGSSGSTTIITTDDDDADASADADAGSDASADADADKDADMPAQSFKDELKDVNRNETLSVVVEAPAGALPKDATMIIKPVKSTDVKAAIEDAVVAKAYEKVSNIQAVDISFRDADGNEIEPAKAITVTLASSVIAQAADPLVVHVDDNGKADVVNTLNADELQEHGRMIVSDELVFDSDKFSVYAVVEMTIVSNVLTSDGNNYKITVACGPEAEVPKGAKLQVEEIARSSDASNETTEYEAYMEKTYEALGKAGGDFGYVRFLDIKIVDENGNKVDIAAPVDVKIELADKGASAEAAESTQVVHFADAEDKGDVVQDVTVNGATLGFEAEGFSVYAIVDSPEPVGVATFVDDCDSLAASVVDEAGNPVAFYLSVTKGDPTNNYFTNAVKGGCFQLVSGNPGSASEWYFELVDAGESTYRIYTNTNEGKRYIKNTSSNNNVELVETGGTLFEISSAGERLFYFKIKGEDKWLQYSGSGKGIRFYSDVKNEGNSKITITYASSFVVNDDPYGLDGMTYGIAYHNNSATSAALTAEAKKEGTQERLAGLDTVMKRDVLDNEGILLVAENTDIQMWTFENVEGDKYHIYTMVDGGRKYLTINGNNVTLQDEPDKEKSAIKAVPGVGDNKGKWSFSVNGYSLNLPNNAEKGFNGATGAGATTWMNVVKKSVLTEEDFVLYNAKKVSVSDDENVYDKTVNGVREQSQVIIYTRIWDDEKKRYEFYAIDHDGSLVHCYDAGDRIEWVGSTVNTALWEFTEYKNVGDDTPNYYYELRNVQYGNYIAPRLNDEDLIMSDDTIGLNLNGRRYGRTYTTIVAWDDASYEYAGLKAENGHAVPCRLSEADDFYFAIVNPIPDDSETAPKPTSVKTINSEQYGITLKMIDYNNKIENSRDSGQTKVLGFDTDGAGLVSSNLGEDGYPVTNSEKTKKPSVSLGKLYDGAREVNNLFLASIYNESGYFEYNSTQNFAHLNEDGNFTVYDQLGAITGNSAHKNTREHGQFMPYNDINRGYAYDNNGQVVTNRTSVLAEELPDTDARKGEKMYYLGDEKVGGKDSVDYFFGMEMSADFTQTANGLDAWGHDIIFEFSGDDDFWFYVDGQLVLDLGGVHQAQVGSVNFRTGEVKSSRGNTTLYAVLKKNYLEQHPGASSAEVEKYLADTFEKNDQGQYIFKDYSNHSMKVFYMERGAGASNLHMRFNLAAVEPGTFMLSKKLSGTDSENNGLIKFPYQVYYRASDALQNEPYKLLEEKSGDNYNVMYEDSASPVEFVESFTPAGASTPYNNVFFLRPGESVQVRLPEESVDYYVVECGVKKAIYDQVSANGTVLKGTNEAGGRLDYVTETKSLKDRQRVDYDNHVAPGAMRTLSITKKLYSADGKELVHGNPTPFQFRLYLGDENDDSENLPLADMCEYHVKDGKGNYCRWDDAKQVFVSLGKSDYGKLTKEEKASATFNTSMYGSISKIPADYTVEVRDLIASTQFKVEERNSEVPRGYTRRDADGYVRMDVEPNVVQSDPIYGVIEAKESETKNAKDPQIEVRNQIGWGLTAKKAWTDNDFMEAHDPIYFAVYLEGKLVEESVRQLQAGTTEVYYFFKDLRDENGDARDFSDFVVREVTIENANPKVNDDGVVEDPGVVTPIENDGELTLGGKPSGGNHQDGYTYKVTYEVGKPTGQNANVRVDTVTNTRPGIELYKTDMQGKPLAGAVFTLTNEAGQNVALDSYTSDASGLITIAYLPAGEYTLTETVAPRGYLALNPPMKIKVGADDSVSVSDVDEYLYELKTGEKAGMIAAIKIKDRVSELLVRKVDASGDQGLEGVHFALYRQVTDAAGNERRDYLPKPGYEDLVTGKDGVLPKVTMDLGPGTYYLEETQAIENYEKLQADVCFAIGVDGSVEVKGGGLPGWLTEDADKEAGIVTYKLAIPNSKQKRVALLKVASSSQKLLEGACFSLYSADEYDGAKNNRSTEGAEEIVSLGPTDKNGFVDIGLLPNGKYLLVETAAPEGFMLPDGPIEITVTDDGVTATQSGSDSHVEPMRDASWRVSVWNNTSEDLPSTGGMGTGMFYLIGGLLIAASGLIIIRSRRGSLRDRKADTKR